MIPVGPPVYNRDFLGTSVLVTGGGRGFGAALSRHFARRGAHVLINYFHSREHAQLLEKEILASGGSCETLWGSVALDAHVDRMFESIAERHGKLDILINNAAGGVFAALDATDAAYWDRAIETNFRGILRCSLAAVPLMENSSYPSIVNVSSCGASFARDGYGCVGATKAAGESLGRSLALELNAKRIRVNNVRLGAMATDIFDRVLDPESAQERYASLSGRMIDPEEGAVVVAFLASPAASSINGATVVGDGGESAFVPGMIRSKAEAESPLPDTQPALPARHSILGNSGAVTGLPSFAEDPADAARISDTFHDPLAIVGIGGTLAGCSDTAAIWDALVSGTPQFNESPRVKPSLLDWELDSYPQQGAFVNAFVPHPSLASAIEAGDWDPGADLGATWMRHTALQALEGVHTGLSDRWLCAVAYSGEMTWARIEAPMSSQAFRRRISDPHASAVLASGYEDGADNLCSALPPFNAQYALAGLIPVNSAIVTADAACASGLAAIRTAATALRTGSCDIAICTGANVIGAVTSALFKAAGGVSRQGKVLPFDAAADGTLLGEGSVTLVLKRLSDAHAAGDAVHAVLLGAGTSADGKSATIHAPAAEGQLRALRRAWSNAGSDLKSADWIITHGTATPVGDRVELSGLAQALTDHPCYISSAKAVFGHTSGVAGLVNVLVACLALKHEIIPMQAGFTTASSFVSPSMQIPRRSVPWPARDDHPRLVGICASGLGGANGHVVLADDHQRLPTVAPTHTPEEVVVIGFHTCFPGASDEQIISWLHGASSAPPHTFGASYPIPKNPPLFIPPVTLAEMDRSQIMAVQSAVALLDKLGDSPRDLADKTGVYAAVPVLSRRVQECAKHFYSKDAIELLNTAQPDGNGSRGAISVPELLGEHNVYPTSDSFTGCMPGLAGARIANYLDFHEGCQAVYAATDAFCSAMGLAEQQLAHRNQDLALVWVVDGNTSPEWRDIMAEFMPDDYEMGEGGILFALARRSTAERYSLPVLGSVRADYDIGVPVQQVSALRRGRGFSPLANARRCYPETDAALEFLYHLTKKQAAEIAPNHSGSPRIVLQGNPVGGASTPHTDVGQAVHVGFRRALDQRTHTHSSSLPQNALLICGDTVAADVTELLPQWPGAQICNTADEGSSSQADPLDHLWILMSAHDDLEPIHELAYATIAKRRPKRIAALIISAINNEVVDPAVGLFTGLVRSVLAELPDSICVAIAVSDTAIDRQLLDRVTSELDSPPPLATVYFDHGVRMVPQILDAQPTDGDFPLSPESVVLAVGGGRGITSEILCAIAERAHPTIYILGRTPLLTDSPQEQPNRSDFIKSRLAEGQSVKSALSSYEQALRSNTVAQTISQLRRICGEARVHYRQCDIANEQEVAAAVGDMPQVTLLLHAATEMQSASLDTKTLEQYKTVRDVKVRGYHNIKQALHLNPPQIWCNFGSLGALGPVGGDSDYIAGCEYLSLATLQARSRGADEFAILWAAWSETGIASDPTFKQNIQSHNWSEWITNQQGIEQFFAALTYYRSAPVVAFFRQEQQVEALRLKCQEQSVVVTPQQTAGPFQIRLSTAKYPWLAHHRVHGEPVQPGLFAVEIAASAAKRLYPGMRVVGARNLRCHNPIYVGQSRPEPLLTAHTTVLSESSDEVRIHVTITADQTHASGTVLRNDLLRNEIDILLAPEYSTLEAPPGRPTAPGPSNPVHARNGAVDLTGPFAATDNHRVEGDIAEARWAIPQQHLDPSLQDMNTPFLMLDAMCQIGLLPSAAAGSVTVGYLKSIDCIEIYSGLNDTQLTETQHVTLRCLANGDRLAELNGTVIARIRGTNASSLKELRTTDARPRNNTRIGA